MKFRVFNCATTLDAFSSEAIEAEDTAHGPIVAAETYVRRLCKKRPPSFREWETIYVEVKGYGIFRVALNWTAHPQATKDQEAR